MRFKLFSRPFAPSRTDGVHPTTPRTQEEWSQCWQNVRSQLQKDNPWSVERLGLFYRTLCVPPEFSITGMAAMMARFDMATMEVLDPQRDAALARAMETATRAGAAAVFLYRRIPGVLEPKALAAQELAQSHYMASVVHRVNQGGPCAEPDELRCMALGAALRHNAAAPQRDWDVLLAEDVRWCLGAPMDERRTLALRYPQTASYLREFSMLCELVSPMEALHRMWYPPTANGCEAYTMPEGFAL